MVRFLWRNNRSKHNVNWHSKEPSKIYQACQTRQGKANHGSPWARAFGRSQHVSNLLEVICISTLFSYPQWRFNSEMCSSSFRPACEYGMGGEASRVESEAE